MSTQTDSFKEEVIDSNFEKQVNELPKENSLEEEERKSKLEQSKQDKELQDKMFQKVMQTFEDYYKLIISFPFLLLIASIFELIEVSYTELIICMFGTALVQTIIIPRIMAKYYFSKK